MRQIKFRMWDFKNKEMYDGDSLAFEEYAPISQMLSQDGIMQYTGLLDRIGNELYEGDIVQNGVNIYEIVWTEHFARYGAKKIKSDSVLSLGCTFPLWQYVVEDTKQCIFEVIGNQFENPELINS
ncbi:YopX family protein [Paenibacillus alba]|uniref:YopX family protein n=1 Tax=Paenibacillus alba TaxID=1197127 RepID=A0ABU6GEM5_9BACL|nr:YopX family protein [Paenibacillus alba]MEC0232684.1 YopX family protein [Paenibacillus alba]